MHYTLITSLGTGLYQNGGYRNTVYAFENKAQIETNVLLKAIIESKQYDIGKIIIIGTKTSSWDILAEALGDTDFWLLLKDTCSATGIDESLLEKLQHQLTEYYHCPVLLAAHNPVISNETIDELFPVYMDAISHAEETHDILLDITHGFRSMPIFMYQALLFRFSHNENHRIEIIYGEHTSTGTISYIRNLSAYWDISQITEAKNLFFKQLDGKLLAEKLEPWWNTGAKCIRAFSGIVECNFALQIPIIINQIRNSLKTVPAAPRWIGEIQAFLQTFEQTVSDQTLAETLYKYANFLAGKKLFVQAVIALQIAVEVKIITAFDKEESSDIGNYDRWQNYYKNFYDELRGKFEHKEKLNRLYTLRNQIAHGGSTFRLGGVPQAVNTEHIFKSAEKRVVEFFRFVDKMRENAALS